MNKEVEKILNELVEWLNNKNGSSIPKNTLNIQIEKIIFAEHYDLPIYFAYPYYNDMRLDLFHSDGWWDSEEQAIKSMCKTIERYVSK